MQTTIVAQGREIAVEAHGKVLTDYQVLHLLRAQGVIMDSQGDWAIGVAGDHAALTLRPRLASGRISRRIASYGPIAIAGYQYRGHGYMVGGGGHIAWSFVVVEKAGDRELIDLLKRCEPLRNKKRWLYWDTESGYWVTMERHYHARHAYELYAGPALLDALKKLLEEAK